jgi:hypothetical protein
MTLFGGHFVILIKGVFMKIKHLIPCFRNSAGVWQINDLFTGSLLIGSKDNSCVSDNTTRLPGYILKESGATNAL